MRVVGPTELAAALDYPRLVPALRAAFRRGATVPLRAHQGLPGDGGRANLLLMPAWSEDGGVGVKLVTVFPENGARGLPAVHAVYILFDGRTGAPTALLDGPTLTARRTAAASALAADYLARPDAHRLLIIGTGVVARQLAAAHPVVRPIDSISVWGRDPAKAERLAAELRAGGAPATAAGELAAAVAAADIVSCATLAREPLVFGDWLKAGAHLDLVGGYTPEMREADDAAVGRARIFVDTRQGAMHEAGDIVDPIRRGVIREQDVQADLYDLARGLHAGRRTPEEITLFKSVGTALEDLAAAELAVGGG